MRASRWGLFFVLGMVGACGGRVAVNDGGGGGDGGAGGVGEVALAACEEWCESRAEHCTYVGSCLDRCLELIAYVGPCQPEYAERLLCLAAHPPLDPEDCNKPMDPCPAELDAVKACVYPAGPCDVGQCVAGPPEGTAAMQCDFVCGDVVYTSLCGESGKASGFPMDCLCQIDGEPVGTCQAVTGMGATSLGCCSAHFAESE